jgi:hypothetical protein
MIKNFHTLFFTFFVIMISSAQKTDWDEMRLKGKVKTMTKTEFKATDSNGVVKKLYAGSLVTYTFNDSGFQTKMTRFDPHTKEIDETSEYLYDDAGKLKKIQLKNQTGQIQWTHQFYYDDKNNQVADTIVKENNKISMVYRYSYNEQGRRNEMNGYGMKTDGDPDHFLKETYQYDSNGNRTEEKEQFYENGKESSVTTKTYSYDPKTNQLKYKTYDSQGAYSLGGADKTTYLYDKNGLLTGSTWGNMKGSVASKSIYKVDDHGNWIEETTYEKKVPVSVTVREIEYFE